MDEDRLLKVLEEIRDLQRRQVEAYDRALANQEQALQAQRAGIGRARSLIAGIAVVIVLVIIIVLVLLRFVLRHYA
jgi:type VI protein secretion system component VasF